MAELVVRNLTKRFGQVEAIKDVSFEVADGEFLTLLGPSGCGKSTTLGAIAGLDRPTGGLIRAGETVFFDGAANRFLPPEARNCGLVFQSYALWPHMTVYANLAFPLRLRRVPRAEREKAIEQTLALVEMTDYADRYPYQLSGGQQQRVALARTLVYRPTLLLLDEPLSNLDAKLRDKARVWLSEMQRRVRLTTIYVTHDQTEALALSDRIAVMDQGRLVQLGTPKEVYGAPATPFVADFIGNSNFFKATIESAPVAGRARARLASGHVVEIAARAGHLPGKEITLAAKPEAIRLGKPGTDEGIRAEVISRSYLGARWQYQIAMAGEILRAESDRDVEGGDVVVLIDAAALVSF